jgi:hypothetical protein
VDGNSAVGYFSLSYASMISMGDSYDNYIWGVNVCQGSSNITVRRITLKDENGNILSEIVPENPTNAYGKYVFEFGNELEAYKNTGTYYLQNTNGNYLTTTNVVLLAPGTKENATGVEIIYDGITNEYTLKIAEKRYVLDIMGKDIVTNTAVKFNASSITRNTQTWRVIENDDGTITIRLAADTRYAVGIKNGVVCLVAGADIAKYGKFNLCKIEYENTVFSAEKVENDLTVRCSKPASGSSFAVTVTDTTGKVIQSEAITFDQNGSASFTLKDVKEGSYVFILSIDGKPSVDHERLIYTV